MKKNQGPLEQSCHSPWLDSVMLVRTLCDPFRIAGCPFPKSFEFCMTRTEGGPKRQIVRMLTWLRMVLFERVSVEQGHWSASGCLQQFIPVSIFLYNLCAVFLRALHVNDRIMHGSPVARMVPSFSWKGIVGLLSFPLLLSCQLPFRHFLRGRSEKKASWRRL